MKKYLLLILMISNLIAAEEYRSRDNYENLYRGLAITNAVLCEEEGKLRTGKIGVGVSGDFILEFKDWSSSALRDGFINLEVNYWAATHINIASSFGYHSEASGQVIPISLCLQTIGPRQGQFDKTPSMIGFEAGAEYFISSISAESTLCFKVGLCSYQFITEYFAICGNIDYLTPSFRDNNVEIKFGVKYFLH